MYKYTINWGNISIFQIRISVKSEKKVSLGFQTKFFDMDDLKPKRRKSRKILGWFIAIVIIALGVFFYIRFYYVFGTGVKSGELNYLVHKGVIFKTYEGKLIQSGFRADKPGGLQSNQFEFSVEDEDIAKKLMISSGKNVQLHYKEYFGALPWRGYTKFIVDSIILIEDKSTTPNIEEELTPYMLDSM